VTPFLTRYRRRWIAACTVTLLAFAHAAIAVSGCLPGTIPGSEAGCEEHQQSTPNDLLCRTHLQAETQTLDLTKLPQLSAPGAPMGVLALERALAPVSAGVALPARIALASAPPPALNVLYSRSLT
jgi:hypothetical protein